MLADWLCVATSSGLVPQILSIVSGPNAKPNESLLWRGFDSVSANNDLFLLSYKYILLYLSLDHLITTIKIIVT